MLDDVSSNLVAYHGPELGMVLGDVVKQGRRNHVRGAADRLDHLRDAFDMAQIRFVGAAGAGADVVAVGLRRPRVGPADRGIGMGGEVGHGATICEGRRGGTTRAFHWMGT